MLRDYRVQGWFWWMAILVCGFSFVLGLDSATASERAPDSPAIGVAPGPRRAAARRAHATSTAMARAAEVVTSMAKPTEQPVSGEPTARGLRRLAASEVSGEMLLIARRIIREHHRARPGTEVQFEHAGRHYVARIERHYHPEGGPVKPWGFHPGVSLLTER